MTSRRGFLGALAAALTLDPERALWVPGAKLISIPRPAPLADPLWLQPPFHFTKAWERSLAHMQRLNEEYDALFAEQWEGDRAFLLGAEWTDEQRARRVELVAPDGARRVVAIRA